MPNLTTRDIELTAPEMATLRALTGSNPAPEARTLRHLTDDQLCKTCLGTTKLGATNAEIDCPVCEGTGWGKP